MAAGMRHGDSTDGNLVEVFRPGEQEDAVSLFCGVEGIGSVTLTANGGGYNEIRARSYTEEDAA